MDKCTIEICDRPRKYRLYCGPHQRRFREGLDLNVRIKARNPGQPCKVDGCEKTATRKQLCGTHYDRMRNYGRLDLLVREARFCSISGCGRPYFAKWLCETHYTRLLYTGNTKLRPKARHDAVCRVATCHQPVQKFGVCHRHLNNLRNYGTYRKPDSRSIRSVEERTWARVNIGDPSECWLWCSTLNSDGYGVIGAYGNRQFRAHRVIYASTRGELPDDLMICHTCDNRRCVNPWHLYAGTASENMIDRYGDEPTPRRNPEEEWRAA